MIGMAADTGQCHAEDRAVDAGTLALAIVGEHPIMNPETIGYINLAGIAGILAFLWGLHRDLANVRERLAKLEGAVEILTRFLIDRERERPAAGE